MRSLCHTLFAILMIAVSSLSFASKVAPKPPETCPEGSLGHVNMRKTLPANTCAIVPKKAPYTRGCDENGNNVERNWKWVCMDYANANQRFLGVFSVPDRGPGLSKFVLVSEKTSSGSWAPRNEIWSKGQYPEVTYTSARAGQIYAQNGGGPVVNVAGNSPTVSKVPPAVQQPGCDALSGLAKSACDMKAQLGKLPAMK